MTPEQPASSSSMGKLVPSQPKSAASKPLVPSQPSLRLHQSLWFLLKPKSATASKPLVPSQPKPSINGSSLTPTKPMSVGTGELSGTPRSQAEMLAMAKLATAAMSPDEAQVADDPSVEGSAMASSTMYDTRKPAVSMPVDSMSQNTPVKTTSLAPPDEIRVIEDISAIHKWDGPQDQAVFEYKFPVTFKECAKKGKTRSDVSVCRLDGVVCGKTRCSICVPKSLTSCSMVYQGCQPTGRTSMLWAN